MSQELMPLDAVIVDAFGIWGPRLHIVDIEDEAVDA